MTALPKRFADREEVAAVRAEAEGPDEGPEGAMARPVGDTGEREGAPAKPEGEPREPLGRLAEVVFRSEFRLISVALSF